MLFTFEPEGFALRRVEGVAVVVAEIGVERQTRVLAERPTCGKGARAAQLVLTATLANAAQQWCDLLAAHGKDASIPVEPVGVFGLR